jgi:DNA polymerase-3 subunit delta
MIHVLYGADDYSARQALGEIKKGLGDPETLATNTSLLDGARLPLADLRAAVEAFPFFGDKRLIVIEGLLSRFEAKSRAQPPKTGGPESGLADYLSALVSAPPTSVIVLLDGELKKTNPMLKELAGKASVREFPALSFARLVDWIKKSFSRSGGAVSDEAAALLARLVGSNLWTMSSEVEKLLLAAEGRRVEASDVEAMVPASREVAVFELVDAVLAGNAGTAQRCLQSMLADGQAPSYILFMLARQLRLLVRLRSMLSEGMAERAAQARLGVPDFIFRKAVEQAARFDIPRLKALYRLLLDADLAIKTGRYPEDIAVTMLVAEACPR